MDFQTAVKTCLTEKYATFSGRASRSEYWWFVLAAVIMGLVISLLGSWLLSTIFSLALFVPAAAAGSRRLQDTGRPGWYIFIPMGLGLIGQLFFGGRVEIDPTTGMPLDMPGMGQMMFMGLFGIVQLVIVVVFIWWLTRPSDEGENEFGPPPAA
ncbi:DUF805 domain-containing protein [Marimonas arenosa]|uniref:DUF805 domain-containing protein n=1 Tax=Marimonas arenosa TaxID=1795305 RepID=A0AAE4B778_9RHOB|nr:DUF805 domain-containing protein [Marimonas arenosa]MDQ2092089.1 DUF805 domain-containing protein [Marimonas arenosa]